MAKKVFVSGCYDLLHSGHVEFFQQASQYGDLYVGIGSDATYLEYKGQDCTDKRIRYSQCRQGDGSGGLPKGSQG